MFDIGTSKQQTSEQFTNANNISTTRVNNPTFNYSSPNSSGGLLDLVSSVDPVNDFAQTNSQTQKEDLSASAAVGAGANAALGVTKSEDSILSPEGSSSSPKFLLYGLAAVLVVGGVYLYMKRKGK